MINALSATSVPSPLASAQPKDDPAKVELAAKSFEALLIGQMLKSMRDSDGGMLGTGDDQSMSSAMEYAQEQFAQALSAGGGLGLAKLVTAGLRAEK